MNKTIKSKNSVKRVSIVIAVIAAIIALIIIPRQIALRKLPVYSFSHELSKNKSFAKSLLQYNDTTYVSDYFEWWLQASNNVGNKIGKTKDGGYLYNIKGQDKEDYIIFKDGGFMSNASIFSRQDTHPKDIVNMSVTKISLHYLSGTSTKIISSDNSSLINETLDVIKQNRTVDLQDESFNSYSLTFNTTELQGIDYAFSAFITSSNHVFLQSFDPTESKPIPAGKLLSEWILNNIKH